VLIFAPAVARASYEEFQKLTIFDFMPVLKTAVMIAIVVVMLGTGNILYLGLAYWYYRQYYLKPKVAPGVLQPMATAR
jgi:hypothetical protein